MLAEIAIANAAFGVIKQALTNGKELYDIADTASTYFDNKAAISRKASKSGNSNELAAFMELQKLQKEEEWLKEHMIYAGDPGMWDAWLQFQSQRKRQREAAIRESKRAKAQRLAEMMIWFKVIGGTVVILPIIIFFFLQLLDQEIYMKKPKRKLPKRGQRAAGNKRRRGKK